MLFRSRAGLLQRQVERSRRLSGGQGSPIRRGMRQRARGATLFLVPIVKTGAALLVMFAWTLLTKSMSGELKMPAWLSGGFITSSSPARRGSCTRRSVGGGRDSCSPSASSCAAGSPPSGREGLCGAGRILIFYFVRGPDGTRAGLYERVGLGPLPPPVLRALSLRAHTRVTSRGVGAMGWLGRFGNPHSRPLCASRSL